MLKLINKTKLFSLISYAIDIALLFMYAYFEELFGVEPDAKVTLIVLLVAAIAPLLVNLIQNSIFERQVKNNFIKVANTLGADIEEAYKFGGIGLVTVDDKKSVIWCSGLFEERNINILGVNIVDSFEELNPLFYSDPDRADSVIVYFNKRSYKVILVDELNLLIFKDITDFEKLKSENNDVQPIVGTLLIDDKGSLISILGEDDYASKEYEANRYIIEWAKDNEILIKKIKDDQYLLILTEKIYQKLKDTHFQILKDIEEKFKTKDITMTCSLGFGRGCDDYIKLSELSIDATNIAISRGGNQVVVNNFARQIDFFGGKIADNKETNKLTKIRIMSESLISHVRSANRVFVVPHNNADFDAIGACLGIMSLVNGIGKEAKLVATLSQIELKARLMFEDLFKTQDYLISPDKAEDLLDDDTLVVVCDCNRTQITTCPKLISVARNVAVIDHHREAEDNISNPVFQLVLTESSSASEIVTQILTNSNIRIKIMPEIATFMYAGIVLDTQNLINKVSPITFKSCMELKSHGATPDKVNTYMQDEYEEFELKSKILSNLESPLYGFAIAQAPKDEYIDRTMLAKAAQAACNIKGVRAAFVIGQLDKKTVGISARSDNSINVQLIMEKLGGGGHYNSSACQLTDTNIDEAKAKLISVIKVLEDEI